MDKTIVSVLMPVYNSEPYISMAIESVLKQTFRDFEFIIIDDGSSDNSLEIIRSFKDERIRIIQNDNNLGLIKTLNNGIQLTRGKYIARMDSDDIAMPDRLEKQVAFLEKNNDIGVVGAKAMVINQHSKPTGLIMNVATKDEEIRTQIIFRCPFIHPSVMGRSFVFKEFMYDERFPIAEDFHLWIQVMEKYKVANLNEVLIKYRVYGGGVSQNKATFDKKISSLKKIFSSQFSKLNFSINETQLHTHLELCSIVYDDYPKTSTDAQRALKWTETLDKHNSKNKWFNEALFQKYLAETWYGFCTRNVCFLGWKSPYFFFKSTLSPRISSKKKILLLLHSTGNLPLIHPIYKFLKDKLLPLIKLKN